MAYQFADPFDNYGNAYTMTAGYPWDYIAGTVTVLNTDFRFAPPGSLPKGCANIAPSNWIRKNLSGTPSTVIVSIGFKCLGLPTANPNDILTFWDGGNLQCSLAVTSTGAMQFWRGNGQAPGGGGVWNSAQIGATSSAGLIQANNWYGLSVQVTISSGSGSVALYVNGSASAAINSSSINTQGTANAQCTQISIGNLANSSFNTARYDDLVFLDTTGSFLTTRPANDLRLLTKLPSAAGTYTNWTPTGLGSNYQNVAVAPPSVSDYNANNVATTKDSYTTTSAGLTITPLFVLCRASLTRDDAGTHTPAIMMRSGTLEATAAATVALGSSYAFYDAVFQNDPNTSSPWTGNAADIAQIGIIEG